MKNINVVSNRSYETRQVRRRLIDELNRRGYHVPKKFDHKAELTISIGGDGAFLKAIHNNRFPKMPIVGINTGTLGFFQEIHPQELSEFLDMYEAGIYEEEKITLLEGKVFTKGRVFTLNAVNEIILKGEPSKIIQMNVFIDNNHLQRFAGDGMMVATPIGSTAYNLSLGGSIVHTGLNSMQLTPMAPINSKAYRSLQSSLVAPPDTLISLVPTRRYKDNSTVVVDGEEKSFYNMERLELTMSDHVITKLAFKKDFYWHNIKDKFI